MRYAALVLAAGSLASAGCSALIVGSGQRLGELTTQTDARAAFGEPVASGPIESGYYDEFLTRRKIAEPWKLIYITIGDVSTLGLGELLWCPLELSRVGYHGVVGQTVRFEYNEAGEVISTRLNGERVPWQIGRVDPVRLAPAGDRPQYSRPDGESR